MLIRLLIYIPLVAFLAVLQSAIVRLFPAVNYQPDLLTVLIVFLAHREGRVVGQSVGFLGGILEDSIGLAPFGFHTLVRTALGYIMGFNREWRVEESPIAALLLVVIGYVVQIVLYTLLGTVASYSASITSTLSIQSIREGVLTVLVTPICFALFNFLPTSRSHAEEITRGIDS